MRQKVDCLSFVKNQDLSYNSTMTVFEHIQFTAPYLRVNNRQHNIAFYQQLGLRVLWEESSLVFLGVKNSQKPILVLEESPSFRTRAVVGQKKLHTLCLTISFEDIEQLLAKNLPVDRVFKGEEGYGFEVTSPEGDKIQVYGNADRVFVEEVDYPELVANPDFQGVTKVTVRAIILHVLDEDKSIDFYENLPLSILPIQGEGADLTAASDETWDLSSLSFSVAEGLDLQELADDFARRGAETFLTRKQTLLVVTAPNGIELWFEK